MNEFIYLQVLDGRPIEKNIVVIVGKGILENIQVSSDSKNCDNQKLQKGCLIIIRVVEQGSLYKT